MEKEAEEAECSSTLALVIVAAIAVASIVGAEHEMFLVVSYQKNEVCKETIEQVDKLLLASADTDNLITAYYLILYRTDTLYMYN
jgi:hypothetical protein